jgi:hypothetical protein
MKNNAEEACVGSNNEEKETEKKDDKSVFGNSSLCFIRITIFTWNREQ